MVLVTKKPLYIVKSKHVLNYIKLQLAFFFLFYSFFCYVHTHLFACAIPSLFPAKGGCQFHEFPGKVHLRHVCGKPGSVQN